VNSLPALRSVVQRRRRALSDACLFLPSAHHSEKSSTLEGLVGKSFALIGKDVNIVRAEARTIVHLSSQKSA
jgi:hypothetical protein